jgi:hypothetical protein
MSPRPARRVAAALKRQKTPVAFAMPDVHSRLVDHLINVRKNSRRRFITAHTHLMMMKKNFARVHP